MEAKAKRLAKNTAFLYLRMLFILFISLYTTRIVLKALGSTDFGIYNVVCGFVALMTFLNGAMGNATQRFISYELEKKNIEQISKVFSQIRLIHLYIAIIVLFMGETFGLWFVNEKLNIPETRLFAVNIVYQCSIVSTILMIISVPYNALIIAHENMKIYAYVGIFEGLAKLLIALVLLYNNYDKLITYGILLTIIAISIRFFLYFFCKRHYEEASLLKTCNPSKMKEIIGFACWSLFGSLSTMANSHGINILVNIFFNAVTNAARGISYQIDSVIRSFIANFQTALNPQIVKSFSAGNLREMHSLLFLGSKISFFIMFILALPIYVNIEYLLDVWLYEIPEYTVTFTRLILINSLVVTFSGTLSIAAQATGKIRAYQITMGSILLLNLPISFILFKRGFAPYSAVECSIAIESFLLFLRLLFLKRMIRLNPFAFFKEVLLPSILSVLICTPCFIFFMHQKKLTFVYFLASFSCCFICSCASVFIAGFNKNQRKKIFALIKNKVFKRNAL